MLHIAISRIPIESPLETIDCEPPIEGTPLSIQIIEDSIHRHRGYTGVLR